MEIAQREYGRDGDLTYVYTFQRFWSIDLTMTTVEDCRELIPLWWLRMMMMVVQYCDDDVDMGLWPSLRVTSSETLSQLD